MQAIQPATPPVQPEKTARRRRKANPRNNAHQAIAVEITAKLVANLVLSICATSALIQLLPHHHSAQQKLREIQAEVKLTQGRVDQVRSDLNRYFDPAAAKSIMQEQTNRVDPQQRQIIWVEKETATGEEPAE